MNKILVVDDERPIRESLRAVLENEGYAVVVAANGVEALELLPRERPDLILMDVMMPEMDGRETLERIRDGGYLHDVRIVMMSAATDPRLLDSRNEVTFLSKPFELDQLLGVIARVL
jgi:two-component system, OmpR family, response regulator MprA